MAALAASPIDNDGSGRKRVCKACDRCRLKKSKCDGSSPCGRCQSDNAICVFGERKKTQDKIYPKGYVEMLEQQQNQLVSGLQELYALVIKSASWKGAPLKESVNGHPLTHDILERLGILKMDLNVGAEAFEEDLDVLRRRLTSESNTEISHHQRSPSSDNQSLVSFPEVASPRHYFGDSYHTLRQFPPTPPIQSPNEEPPYTSSPSDCQNRPDGRAGLDPSVLQTLPLPVGHQPSAMYDESLDFLNFDLPSNFDPSNPLHGSMSPGLSMSPWLHDDL